MSLASHRTKPAKLRWTKVGGSTRARREVVMKDDAIGLHGYAVVNAQLDAERIEWLPGKS
jgi:hypothetical protein